MRLAVTSALVALALAAGPAVTGSAQQDNLVAARTRGSATAPVTNGVDMDVPLILPYLPFGRVLSTLEPGAINLTIES